MKFPNRVIEDTYEKAVGHTFRLRLFANEFIDEDGSTDYNYWAMTWLLDNGILIKQTSVAPVMRITFKLKETT